MNCTINDINLTFDQNGRLRTTIGRVTGFDIKKAYVLASFLQDQKFKKYLLANITENDVLKDNNVDFKNFTENDYVKLNQNKLGALLNTYYIEHYFSVNNSKTNKGLGNLSGFTSASAKTIAKNHTANLIIDAYYEEFGKTNPKKAKDIILAVNEQILTTFFERVAKFAEDVSVTDGHSKEAKDYAKKYIELNQSIKELYDKNKEENNNRNFSISDKKTKIAKIENLKKDLKQFKEGDDNYKRILQQIKSLTKEIKQLETESINPILNNIKNRLKEIAILERDKYVMAQNLVNLYCTNTDLAVNERLRNYANLVAQTRGDANGWYFQVFNTKSMTSVIKEFNSLDNIEKYIEEQDENNDDLISSYNGESVDETAKSWEDNLYKSFNQIINGRLKLELSRIPKLKNRFNKNSKTQAVDTNNELGVPTYMDTQFVSVQIFTFGNFNSVRSFVDSLEEKSNNIKSLYGLGSIVNRMKRDKVFANYMYANFAKPIDDKTMLTINDVANGSFNFEYSNPNAFPITELVFRITNKIRATYNTSYNKKDIIELSNILEEFESGNSTVELKDRLYKIISNYISAFDKEVFNNYFDNIGANVNQRVPNLINSLRDIINGIGYLKDEINKEELENNKNFKTAREQYQNDYREWLKLPFMQRKETPEPQYPKYEYVDYSSKDLNSTIYKGIFNFAKEIVEFTEARVRLNTTNSEGNSASDVIKNCFVTRFFDQINAKSEEDSNAGLKNLLKFVTQGTENGQVNQYSNNPLLFGIKDENGQIVSPGMFTRVGDEFRINPNAKEILKNNLFDGVKNNKENTADSYASMTKLDFFVTQYLTFRDGVTEFTENGKQTKIGKQDNAVYAMRIGSDAPKIFFIRAPKYNYTQLELAFYNHVIGELNTFCKALNNIFVQESDGVFRTTTNIDKLIGRAFYDERTADKIKHDKGTDFTEAIVQDGRLVGNMFAFKRLFDTNGYSASNKIETMLSLYGGGNTEGLIIPDNNGRLSINPSRINNTSQNQSIIWTGERFVLNLSIEQKQILKGIVKQWMNNYVQEITNRTSEFTKVMKENGITTDRAIVHSYLLNSANMNMCYDDLFEGDYKYYNNARDFLKRTKEVQAGGDVYAGYDLLDANNDVLHDLEWYGTPEYINIKTSKTSEKGQYVVPTHKGNRIENAPMVARNGWRAITIYNTNKASDVADEMQKNLEDNFIKDGMSEEAAHKRSVLIASGYGHNAADIKGETTKINDAQSYITFEEFIRRRHADGTIDQYQDLIAQLLDPNISAEEIDLTDINVRIQVQKNFYFDIRFDANTGLYYPRQIKNAEFVLIPKLLPKDSQLRKVYDFMKKHDIGQLNTAETSKAAKRTIFTIWDQKTGEFNENFEKDFNKNYVENYFYQYLYKQQEVPEHIKDAKNKAGIQITKKIIDNVISRANKNSHLQKWASDYQNAYSINIEESFYEFLETVGWALDSETGKIVNAVYATTDSQGNELSEETIKANKETLNFNKFYQLAREEAARVGRDSNFMEYLIPNEFGDPEMPNYMSNVMSSLESIAQSIFNSSITRQTFPGWHAAQITGVGYSKKLQFDPKTGVMQVYLPRWSKLIPKGKNAEEDAKILQQIQNEGLDIHLGYRIPTEGKQSISVLRVVGFTNECLGSTIIVPDDWVTQTGSDFDVDSIYGITYEIYQKKDKKGNITVHKIPFEEKEVNNQDLYIQYINSKLENKIKLKDVSDISGDIKNDIEDIKNELNNTELRGTLSKEFDKLDEQRNELYEKLPSWARGIIKTENEQAKKLEKKDKIVTDLRNVYGKINEKFEEQLNKRTLDDETKEDIQEYMDLQTGLIDVMNRQEGIPGFDKEEYKSKKAEAIQSIIETAKQEWIKTLEEKAKTLGLLSFDEFIKLDHLRKLSRRARNNYILDRMIKIMNDPASHEEQYGRSKFDDISNANKLIDKLYGKEGSKTSPYNQLDQLDYFDDALGGARLKALSVNHDRFNSINNKVRAELSDEDAIEVILNVGDKSAEDSDIIYDENIIRENYDDIKELNKQQNIIDEKILEDVDKKIGIDNAKTTINTLNSDNNELSEQEKEIIKKELGNKPRVLVASEATDPVFHAAKIKKLVNDELAKPAKDRKFQMMYLITKHDGIPFKELAELKIPKFIHFSITSLGGTKYEPGVMKMDDLLDRIEQFIKDKVINPNLVTIRIDPIVPGVTKEKDIRHIIERATSMGIRQFKFSIMDSYGSSENTEKDRYVVQKMKSLGYEWDKYYEIGRNGKYSFNPKLEYMNYYYQLMDNLANEFRINMWTCGEQPNFNLKRVRTNVGCINVDAMNKAMGTKDITDVKGSQRKECSCYGNKSDACSYNDACASSCMYCYAKHNSDHAMKYYDKNGNLLDNDFTRTVKNNYINEKYPIVELKHEKVLKEEYGLNIPKISNENKPYLRYYLSKNITIGDNNYKLTEIFPLLDALYAFEQNLNSDKDVVNQMSYRDFINKYPIGKQIGFIQSALDGQFGFYKEFKYEKGKVFLRKSVFKLLDNIKNINPNLLNDISISEIINDNYLIEDLINEINDNVKINDSRQLELNFNEQQTTNKKQILFKANRIGWSNNNRNIVGEIVTSYGSQTTAHHLDAVKMGSVPNVNEYTFSVYKLLSSLGLDHEFAIAFIRQPAITSIVNNNNLLESVYFSSRNNPINLTLKEIANRFSNTIPINEDTYYKQKYKKHLNKYGEFDEDTIIKLKLKPRTVKKNASLHNTLAALKNNDNFINAFRKLFDIDISNMSVKEIYNIKVPLNKEQLFTRIKREAQGKGNVFENAAFDFAMALNFKQYKNTANKLEDYINVTAADKFGAEISVRKTRLIKETVAKLRGDMTLSKNGVSFIDLIYPIKNNDENQIDIERSSYKSIASVYAYATIPSIQTSSQLFITENDNYADVVSYIEYKIKHKLNDNEYKEYKRYAMNYLYNHISKLLTPLIVNQKGQIIYNIEKIEENEIKLKTANKYWDIERSRILGYGIVTDGDFTPENLNKPTENDIKQFNELTPAQKVLFMQKHYPDGQGIFNYIKVTLLNSGDIKYKGLSRQYLAVDDQVDNIEDLFQLFINSFSNKNPLIKLATIDLIKYSFIAEGYNFKSGYTNKIIPNSTLYTSDKDGGMDIIKDIKSQINYFYNQLASDEFIDNFVRSHSELIKLDKFAYYESEFESLILKNKKGGGLIYINDKDLIDKLNLKNRADGYVRLSLRMTENEKTVTDISLYKVLKKADDKYFLLPLNTLDKYETHDYSYNANNNKFATLEYYKDLAQKWYTEGKFVRASKFEPIYKYTPDNQYDPKDTFMLMKAYNSGDEITKAGVKKLIDSIEEYLTNTDDLTNHAFVQFNPNFQLKKILPRGSSIIQTISLSNGTDVDIVIQHPKLTTIPSSEDYKQAIQDMNDSKTLLNNADFYRVVRVVDDTKVKKAATELLDNEETFDGLNYSARKDKSFDQVSFDIIKEINYDARKNESSIAERFMKEMDRHNVNRYYGESISKNKENIYKSAARYYKSAANGIINKLNSFTIDHTEYSMDDENMYLALQQHDEYFREVASIILEGITFGNRISGIFQLDIRTEDKETKEAIESIIASINSVRNNKKLKDAMNNIINIYFKKYSTNPDIINDLITLREQFGDLESIDSWITDPTEIDNNEVQVILKQVYGMFNKAEMFDTKQNVKEWEDALAEIEAMREELDINKIIDFDNFKVRQDYNEKYLKARQEVIDKCNDAKLKRNNSFEDFVNYVKAKYDRDLFMYEHQHQQIVPEYYKQNLEMRKEAMEKAGDLYYKYLQLTSELYNDNGLESDEEKANRKARIKAELSQLKSETSDTGVSKSEKETLKVKALNNFINSRRKLQEEFFDSQEYEGFKDNYIRYKEFIDDYDEKYKLKTLEEKLENDEYREAYEWIRDNGHIGFSKEMSDKLKQAFKTLSNRTTVLSKKTMTEIKQNPNVLDEFGNVDPRKLTEEQIADIRNDESTDLSLLWDDGLGETMLIKNVPSNLPVLERKSLKKAHKSILEELKYEDNVKKFKIIARINEILGKAINKTNGEIEVATLFDDYYVTNEERIELGKLYEDLRQLQKANRRIYKKRKNEVYTEEINNTGFTIAMSYYNNNLRNTKQSKQFLDIFTEIDDNGNLVANRLLFGYLMPTEDYINKEKTDARNFIEENVVFVTTQYYQLAKEEAASKGQEEYDKWFKANHIYNPYLHRYEPLKIWTKLEAKPNSKLAKSVTYIPTFENMEKSVKDKYINNVENRRRLGLSGEGFKKFSNNYKKGDSKFDTNIKLNEKEEKLRDLITTTLNKYATTYQGKRFVGQGFLPRERKTEKTTSWALGQLGSLLGISWHSGADSDAFHESVDYSHDKEADMTMLTLIKTKGTQEYKSLPKRIDYNTEEEYLKDLAKIKEENRKITEENLKIDSKNINKDWKEVMKTFIHNATIFNSRQSAKPYLYLLLEDLANNNAYMLRGMFDKRVVKTDSPKDNTMYRTVEQKNTYDVIHNLTRRLLFGQYHENSKPRAIANLLQNMTSAKYMVFNGYGGIANVATGKVNIAMEEAANEYFGYADFHKAEVKYLANIVPTIASLYSDKAPNITVGLMKHFHIINFDQVLEFASGDGVEENLKRVRNWMYSFQSMGEHLMQNSVLLAMLNSNRLYTDSNGVKRIGDFKDYTTEIEKLAMLDVIKGNELLRDNYLIHLERIKNNVEKKLDITTGKQDFNRSFLLNLKNSNEKEVRELYRKTSEAYAKRREELMKQEKEKFYKNPTVESLYELKDGIVQIKPEILAQFNKDGKNAIGSLEKLLGEFKEKVISVNKKIHGVYDKNGAAKLESKWYGSLIMQYHKHLWTGIMKRWRRKGYYSEFRGSKERGSYQTLIDFLGTEFVDFNDTVQNKVKGGEHIALASIQTAMRSILDSFINIQFNWNMLSNWERANIRRNLGEMSGVLVACLVVMALYGVYDDDEIKDDRFKASLLYLADRLYSDTTMYTPIGLITEAKTAWSSPIASGNGPSDLIKAMMMIPQALFDPDFNPNYQTGRYAGENKLWVLFRRNMPAMRPIYAWLDITENTNYYKVGQSQIGINASRRFGELFNE